jgi:multidrug efflux pump subunit AcrA (membrane-fusion protein)
VKKRVSVLVTVIIAALTAIFALSTLFLYINKKQPAPATGSAPAAAAQPASGQRQPTAGAARNATAVRVTPVVFGTIENSIVINGDVLAGKEVSIYPTVSGELTEMRFRVGDTVRQGQSVAMIDPSRPGEVYSRSPVESTVGGTILSAPVTVGDTVSANTTIYTVGDISNLVVETFVPERFSTAVKNGLSASVFLEALPNETFAAVVNEVNPVLDPASRTLRIRLRFTQRDPRIRAGMFTQVSLVTAIHSEVPIVPRAAVINTYGSWIVFVVDGQNTARRREISFGLESEEMLEVLDGLAVGDRVVIAGQNFLTDGDAVRIVE